MKENDRKVVSTDHRAYGELHGTLCMTEKDRGKYPVFLFHGDIKLVLLAIHKNYQYLENVNIILNSFVF